ncbi:3,4-dihydroxy-2-butanone-4-phosphate synthase [Bartonella sp. TP]|uniref:3,4-dihydroxy-2-butanone-4-phosphate synthase n=1 Tax=Bartonella sp. TP TaxID=3057550 RepID=UPI0025B25056|nr:3,4-dihydroxy-2-butanone-4-phosphate synthase [Bartonella sp. TP]WJW80195.1 3,4-dihydroxy-2-butanone-4-phosphate synthase [Bartonella sp. TP]
MYNEENLLKALAAFAKGQMVVVTDDNNRENEGDLVIAANHCTVENMAFMIRHTSGIICAPLTKEIASKLDLPSMVEKNSSAYNTAFTVSVDSKRETTTGISAAERTATVNRLANSSSAPWDFVRPGHIFPLIAKENGVLTRSGHTEAAVDLCKLAGLPEVAVIGELMNDDGTVQHGEEVSNFAAKHDLPLLSVEDLIIYRQRHEELVKPRNKYIIEDSAFKVVSYDYAVLGSDRHYTVLVIGDTSMGEAALFVEQLNFLTPNGPQFVKSTEEIDEQYGNYPCAVCIRIVVQIKNAKDSTLSQSDAENYEQALGRRQHWSLYGASAQILRNLGITNVYLPDIGPGEEHKNYKKELNACGIHLEDK